MNDAKKLFTNSSIIFVGTIVGSFFAYLFNMLVGRMLGPILYGQFAALLSLMLIVSVFGGAVLTVTMKYSGELYGLEKYAPLKKLIKVFSKYVLFFGLLLFFLSLIFLNPLSKFFSISSLLPIAITLFSFVFGFLIMVNKGLLQGTQRFRAVSTLGALESGLRLLIGIILIKIGFSVSGAMLGVVLSTIIAYFLTFIPIKKLFAEQKTKDKNSFSFNKKEIVRYTGPTLLATIFLMIAVNLDILAVKHYFPAEEAGIYAAISTIAKIILYATAPIVSVMFPMITEKKATGEKHYKLFLFSLALTMGGALLILMIYYIAPGTVIKILYGNQYISYYYLLPQIGFVILIYSLINTIVNYFLSIKNFVFIPISFLIISLQIFLIIMNHSSLEIIIKFFMITFGLLFVILVGYYLLTKKEQLKEYLQGNYES